MKPRDEVSNSAVAVIGMAGRFPGANSVAELWENLRNGVESVSPITLEEWAAELNVHPSFLEKPDQVPWRPRIDGVELFDASFFGYTPREAQILDPQQRLFLECSWEALESAGYDSERFPGVIGVAVGISQSTYLMHYVQWDRELVANMGGLKIGLANMNDALATRVAYKLNLRGPAYAVQSFCSTSLVAVHLACQSLLNRESDMMLAGGVTVAVPQNAGYQYQEGGILSPDGHTRTFDAQGRGMVFANGLGCVVLKRLADALRDGDSIHGLILGSAVNNDGSVKVGFTAPSVNGQAEVIVEALAAADVNPETIGYVEAHGTATALGDPAEIAGLTKAWRRWTDKRRYCGIGSVKTNIGHLDAAAGVTGLVKAILCLEKREIPPSLHFETPNPQIDFEASPFYVTARLADWPAPEGRPRRAAVSSFGIGGTNAHAVLEEAPPRPATDPARPWQLLVVSAKTASALDRATARLAAHLAAHPDQNLADAAFTLQLGRREFNHRRFAVVRDGADAVSALQHPARLEGGVAERQGAPVAFMFTGQGAQYVNMGRGLYEEEAVFRETLDACAEALRAPLGLDLRDVLFCRGRSEEQAAEELRQTRLTQPALFAVEYSLARLWMALGVEPSAMIGHSIGEYVAACVAGVFAFEDALALVAERGRLMQSLPAGGMLAVPLGEAALRPRLDAALDLASLNTPRASVVSGPLEAITRLERELMARDVACRLLHTSHAFHSRMMEPILPAFRERVAAVERRAPRLRFVSNATGDWISADQARDPEYWARHLRAPVRFSEGLARILAEANPVLLEVGPGGTLCALARQQDREEEPASVASLRHPKQEADDRAVLLGALGKLWLAGARVEWSRMHAGERRRRLELPSYPFERERYWVEPNKESRDGYNVARGYSLERQKIADWFYQVSWRRYLPAEVAGGPSQRRPASWLVFSDDTGIGQALVEELRAAGQRVVSVRPRARFAACDDGAFEIAPGQRADYDRLLDAIGEPGFVVHAWGVSPPDPRPPVERLAESHERGFLSLLFLAQSLARSQSKQTIQLAVVTSGMQDVVGGDLTCPEKATVLGPCRVIPQELTNVVSHAIDVEPAGLSREDARRQARWVLAELTSSQGDLVVAYRGGHRWVQSFEATPLEPADGRLPLKQRGVYLITGGLGGIGLALARHLAERWQARLVLTGRSPVPAREEWAARLESGDDATRKRIRDLLDLEARGAEVLYLRADVARREDVQAAVRAAHERFGPLQGLVHAAGVAGGGVIPLKDPAAAARVMAPKVQGTLLLEAELGAEPLDFVLLCSSTAALLGGFGQIDYCGANCFLDAQARRAGSPWAGRVVSVNWDAWKEVGMAVNTPVSGLLQVMRDFQLKLGISPGEGIDAFNRILAAGVPQVAVFTMDLRPGLARLALGRAPAVPLASAAATLDAGPAAAAVGEAVAEAEGPGGELERLVAQAFEKVLGRRNLGPDDNFFELGGDSLTAIQAIAVLKTRLGRDIPIVAFYESPTVAQLAKTLAPERDEKPEGVISEVGQRAATRRDLMQRRRQQRVQAAIDGRG